MFVVFLQPFNYQLIMANKNFTQDLKFFFKNRGIKQNEVAQSLGVSHPVVSNVVNGRDKLGKQSAIKWGELLDIDPLWLMTQGEQGINPNEPQPSPPPPATDAGVINVPVINLYVRGRLLPNNEMAVAEFTSATMPFSRLLATDGDVVVPVFGDSMSPCYPSGSHILIRPLPMWREWLELGQSYVLELADWRRTIKIVRKGSTPDSYRLECYNVDYDTTEIAKTMIEHVWQVLAVVKRETL